MVQLARSVRLLPTVAIHLAFNLFGIATCETPRNSTHRFLSRDSMSHSIGSNHILVAVVSRNPLHISWQPEPQPSLIHRNHCQIAVSFSKLYQVTLGGSSC